MKKILTLFVICLTTQGVLSKGPIISYQVVILMDSVVLEPNNIEPERIRIYGTVAFGNIQNKKRILSYNSQGKGYVYFTRKEYMHPIYSRMRDAYIFLKKIAGSGATVVWGYGYGHDGRIRPLDEKPEDPDPVTVDGGFYAFETIRYYTDQVPERGNRTNSYGLTMAYVSNRIMEFIQRPGSEEKLRAIPKRRVSLYDLKIVDTIYRYKGQPYTGEITDYYGTGELFRKGYLKKGKKEGNWTLYFKSGKKMNEEIYVDNSLNGDNTIYSYNGIKSYVGSYKNGILNELTTYFENGKSHSTIKAINKYKNPLLRAEAGDSVTIELEDDIDISRGDTLTLEIQKFEGLKNISSKLCWLGKEDLSLNKRYLLQYGSFRTPVQVTSVNSQLDFESLEFKKAPESVRVNSINEIELKSASPLFIDNYKENTANGYFILIDEGTNATVGVGFKN